MRFRISFFSLVLLQCAACASSISIPLFPDPETRHIFVKAQFDGSTGIFLIDTGTSMPVVSERFLARNELEIERQPFSPRRVAPTGLPGFARLQHQDLEIVRAESFSIGNARFDSGAPFLVLELTSLDAVVDTSVDGIIGGGLLNGASYKIDFPAKQVTMTKHRLKMGSAHALDLRNQLPYVTIPVNGHDLSFMIDTGALQTTIEHGAAELAIPPAMIGPSKPYKLLTFEGLTDYHARRAIVSTLRIADETFKSIPVFLGPVNVIGLDILRQGVLTVDPRAGLFTFERTEAE